MRRCEDIEDLDPHNCPNPIWEYEGIKGSGERPDLFGQYIRKRLIIVARAAGMWEDYAAARDFWQSCGYEFDIMCVNSAAIHIKEHVEHVVTAHPELIPGINLLRTSQYFNGIKGNTPHYHSDKKATNCYNWEGLGNQVGTSGMLACLIAICLGYERIVLAGMPIDFSRRHYDDPPAHILPRYDLRPSNLACAVYMGSWSYAVNRLETFAKKIRSVSGPTSSWLGKPDKSWADIKDGD